jgi:DNA-directed RNA polymerase subunit beta
LAASTKIQKRVNFSSNKFPVEYPDFLDIQVKSFQDFFQLETTPENRKKEGLFKVFAENFPISDARNNFVLEFKDYYIDPPRYALDECIERGLTYSVPLKAKLYLYCTDPEHEDFEPIMQDVYLGTIPYMTPKGSFRNCIVRLVYFLAKAVTLMVQNYTAPALSLLKEAG